jgi:hypothetical protein
LQGEHPARQADAAHAAIYRSRACTLHPYTSHGGTDDIEELNVTLCGARTFLDVRVEERMLGDARVCADISRLSGSGPQGAHISPLDASCPGVAAPRRTHSATMNARYTAVVFGVLAASSATSAATHTSTHTSTHTATHTTTHTSTHTSPASYVVGSSTYTVPGALPTSFWTKYYNNPTQTYSQAQPVVSDPVTVSNPVHCIIVGHAK